MERTPSRLNPLANIAAIRLDRGEAPKVISGSQFLLFEMLTDLRNSDSASTVVIGICIDMSQERASGGARSVGVRVLFNRYDHPFQIDPAAVPVLFRPAKRSDVRALLTDRLDNASLLHAASFLCR